MTETDVPQDVTGILVTLQIEETQKLFVLLGKDGTINRMGTGAVDCTEKTLYMGMTEASAFESVRPLAAPVLSNWIGGFSVPKTEGKLCQLIVGFRTATGQEFMSLWKYGSDSQGPPPEVCNVVMKTVEATDTWYAKQKSKAEPPPSRA